MFTVLRRSPKLLPFWALSKLYLSIGLPVQASRLTSFLPSALYDLRRVDGIRFGVRLSRPADYEVIYGSHEKAFFEVKPQRGNVAVDAGAHIGSYTLRYSRLVGDQGRVIAFEPDPENRRILRWNVMLNKARNVQVRREALGDFTGTAKLTLSPTSTGHSLLNSSRLAPTDQTPVPVIRLDDVGLDRLDLLKMDVEGFEMNVLRGGEKTLRSLGPRLQIEVHSPHALQCQVCAWLGSKRFSTRIVGENPGSHWVEAQPT